MQFHKAGLICSAGRSQGVFRLGCKHNTTCVGLAGTNETSYSAGAWAKCINFRTIILRPYKSGEKLKTEIVPQTQYLLIINSHACLSIVLKANSLGPGVVYWKFEVLLSV